VPVIASHAGVRFGGQQYMLAPATVERIAARDGVVGLILAQHQLNDGLRRRPTKTLEESLDVLWRHIDRLHEITGSHRHTAIGSDLDGFIKPTLGGLESMADMAGLERAVRGRYGDEDGELICAGNALRVLRTSLDLRRAPGALSPARTDG
jgi:microsomal dipeptidase-like Zn-dependent dipeptidase